jgi:2-oxoisovalerate dehydrogenase E1 component alpha subunit
VYRSVRDKDRERLRWAQMDARRATMDLPQETLLRLHRSMTLARMLDDRLMGLRLEGQVSGGASCRGHEAAQAGAVDPLRIGLDYVLPYYRDLAAMIALGMSPEAILLNQFGAAADPISGGRARPAQWNSRALNVVSASGLVGTQVLHAAGIAFALKLRREPAVAMTFFGDGATSEGDFHEALNFAGIHQVPCIFVCENNGIALSTPIALQMAVPHVADRAAAYGMPGVIVDGSDVLAVTAAAHEAVTRAREGRGPTLLEVLVPRLALASPLIDPRDPIEAVQTYLLARGELTPESLAAFQATCAAQIEAAVQTALVAPKPDPATVADDLYARDLDKGGR